jgi:bacterioferritin-associated ferredoxin
MKQTDVARELRMSDQAVSQLLQRAEDRVQELVKLCGMAGDCGLVEYLLN